MGPHSSTHHLLFKHNSKSLTTELELLLTDTYQNTNLSFTSKELTQLNLRLKDAQNYFFTSFHYYLYFNNSFFQDWVSILYDNFNNKIESFSPSSLPLLLFVDFDDEVEYNNEEQDNKMEYEPLFTIIFEKLEIDKVIFLSLTNYTVSFLEEFFAQLYENSYLFKTNRMFDCLYFLFSNTDYFIRNDNIVAYIGMKQIEGIDMYNVYNTNHTPVLYNEYTKSLYHNYYFETFLKSTYPKSQAVTYFKKNFIEHITPSYIKISITLNVATDPVEFVIANETLFEMADSFINTSPIIIASIKLEMEDIKEGDKGNIELFIKNLLPLFDQSKYKESVLILKMYYIIQSEDSNAYLMEDIEKTIKTMIKESFGYHYGSNDNKRKLIVEIYKVKFSRMSIADDNIEDLKMMDLYDCVYWKEKCWYSWFIKKNEMKPRHWGVLYLLYTKKMKRIGEYKKISGIIDKMVFVNEKYVRIRTREKGRMKENVFLNEFYS